MRPLRPRGTGAQRVLGGPALPEAADPGARGKAVEPHPLGRGIRVVIGGDGAVMHQPMRAGVLAEQHRGVIGRAQPEQPAVAAVDQLMRRRMRHLPQPEAAAQKHQHPLAARKAGRPRNGPGRQRQKRQRRQADGGQKQVRAGKLPVVPRRAGDMGQKLVQYGGKAGHVQEPRPQEPAPRPQPSANSGTGVSAAAAKAAIGRDLRFGSAFGMVPCRMHETLARGRHKGAAGMWDQGVTWGLAAAALAAAAVYWLHFCRREDPGPWGRRSRPPRPGFWRLSSGRRWRAGRARCGRWRWALRWALWATGSWPGGAKRCSWPGWRPSGLGIWPMPAAFWPARRHRP